MSEVLKVGDNSPRVAEVRTALARLGLLSHFENDLKDNQVTASGDTYFDEHLSRALRGFQQERGIIASGEINETTLKILREASYQLGARALSYQPDNEMVGDDVIQLQRQLQELGFYAQRVDGHFGMHTYQALLKYQMNYGLTMDGVCGPKTIRALGRLGRRITGGSPHVLHERERVRAAGPRLTGKRVVIDPALGGQNKGQIVYGLYGEITEEELMWDLACRIEGRMIAAGMETIISRPRQENPTLQQRADIANAFNADLMICLQADKYHNEKANGCASFYYGSHPGDFSIIGEQLSGFIQREIASRTKLVNCGNHSRTWDLLRITQMPCIEVVTGYLTNPGDVRILTNPAKRDAIAEAIVVSVKRLYLMGDNDQPTGTYKFSQLLEQEMLEA